MNARLAGFIVIAGFAVACEQVSIQSPRRAVDLFFEHGGNALSEVKLPGKVSAWTIQRVHPEERRPFKPQRIYEGPALLEMNAIEASVGTFDVDRVRGHILTTKVDLSATVEGQSRDYAMRLLRADLEWVDSGKTVGRKGVFRPCSSWALRGCTSAAASAAENRKSVHWVVTDFQPLKR
jgi:hypothetical protein